MNATQELHNLGQSLWLDNITRGLLTSGTLGRYIRELAVTGLTSNPTIFDHAIKDGDFYDAAIRIKARAGESGEALFFELALEDLTQAADLFRPIHDASGGVDGWVSLEVSPLLAAADTINIMPEKTLLAFAEQGKVRKVLPADEGYAEVVLAEFTREGVDLEALAAELQREGTAAFARSCNDLMYRIAEKTEELTKA